MHYSTKSASTLKTSQFRNISGLFHFDKIFEKLLAQLMIEDMRPNLDPVQYGNQEKTSIQHYLVQMIHKILSILATHLRSNANSRKGVVLGH